MREHLKRSDGVVCATGGVSAYWAIEIVRMQLRESRQPSDKERTSRVEQISLPRWRMSKNSQQLGSCRVGFVSVSRRVPRHFINDS